jgi:hypothetical protein
MSDSDMDEMIVALYTPWDERAWENLTDTHGDVAERLLAAAAQGVTPETIRRYGEQHGYSPRVVAWLEQSCRHVKRTQAKAAE